MSEAEIGLSEEDLRMLAAEEGVADEDAEAAIDELLGEHRFVIDSEDRAAWAVNKLLGYDEEAERVALQAQRMIDDIKKKRASFLGRFEEELRAWLSKELNGRKGKKRSVDLLTGRIGFRRKPGGFRVKQEEAVLAWALEQKGGKEAGLFKEVPVLSRTAVKEHHEATGEIPPGCEITEDSDTFYVKRPKD